MIFGYVALPGFFFVVNLKNMTSATGIIQVLRRGLLTRLLSSRCTAAREKSSLWCPDYLEAAKSKFPEYEKTNIQIKGYDFAILENYQRKIHRICKLIGVDVSESWAQEHQKLKVIFYKPKSDTPASEITLKRYERNVQVSDVYSYQMGTLIDLVTSMCPAGVTIQFHPHQQFHYDNRFVPEIKLLELKEQLQELENEK